MSTFIFYIRSLFNLLATYPYLLKYKKIERTDSADSRNKGILFANEIAKRWAVSQMKIARATVYVTGTENIPKDEAVLFVSNHQSNFDTPFLLGYIDKPKGFIAKTEMKKVPLLRDWMQNIGCIFMDRSDIKQSAKAIIEGIQTLKNGYSLVVFPEGTRSKTPQMGEFKAGSFKLATKAKVPIVPVTVNGTYKLYEGNQNKIQAAQLHLTIHPPVPTKELTPAELIALPKKVRDIIQGSL